MSRIITWSCAGIVGLKALLFFSSCAEEESTPALHIDTARPREITQGVRVTMEGEAFGKRKGDVAITLSPDAGASDGLRSFRVDNELLDVSNEKILFTVPKMVAGSYSLHLSVGDADANLLSHFSYVDFSFHDFSPRIANLGSSAEVTLSGTGFGLVQGELSAYLNDTPLIISSLRPSKIVVRLPDSIPEGTYDLYLLVDGVQEKIFPKQGTRLKVRDVSVARGRLEKLAIDDDPPTELGRIGADTLQQILGVLSVAVGVDAPVAQYSRDVMLYKIRYRTTYKQQPLTASAVVAVPAREDVRLPTYPMHLWMSGTITKNEEAVSVALMLNDGSLISNPTVALLGGEDALSNVRIFVSLAAAAMGHVVVFPDGIGFGDSRGVAFHPYLHEASLATSAVDAVLATKEFANVYLPNFEERVDLRVSDRLTIAGYSEGAYAAIATHKKIETEKTQGLVVIASYAGGGPYLLEELAADMVQKDEYKRPFFLPYLYLAYQALDEGSAYEVSAVFQQPYADRIADVFDVEKNLGTEEINERLTTNLNALLTEDFRDNFLTGDAWQYLRDDLMENSLDGGTWLPEGDLHFYHSAGDELASHALAVQFSERLKDRRGTGLVSFKEISGAPTHDTAFVGYFSEAMRELSYVGGEEMQ